MDLFTSNLVFYVFAAIAIVFSLMVVFMKNPVSSAMAMAISFGAVAGVMFQLGAHFMGIIQILVYSGAVMVLFMFIIMLLNVKAEKSPLRRPMPVITAMVIAGVFFGQLLGIIYSLPGASDECNSCCPFSQVSEAIVDLDITETPTGEEITLTEISLAEPANSIINLPEINPQAAAEQYPEGSKIREELASGEFPDTALVGYAVFTKYNYVLILAGIALLVATIGAVVLCRRHTAK